MKSLPTSLNNPFTSPFVSEVVKTELVPDDEIAIDHRRKEPDVIVFMSTSTGRTSYIHPTYGMCVIFTTNTHLRHLESKTDSQEESHDITKPSPVRNGWSKRYLIDIDSINLESKRYRIDIFSISHFSRGKPLS